VEGYFQGWTSVGEGKRTTRGCSGGRNAQLHSSLLYKSFCVHTLMQCAAGLQSVGKYRKIITYYKSS